MHGIWNSFYISLLIKKRIKTHLVRGYNSNSFNGEGYNSYVSF